MKDRIEEALEGLEPAKRGNQRGQTRAIRERHAAIEAALARGVTRQQIVELLQREGVGVTFHFFKNALQRIRQQKKRSGNPPSAPPAAKLEEAPSLPATPKPEPISATSDPWQRIDEIRNSTPDLQALRRKHLQSLKKDSK